MLLDTSQTVVSLVKPRSFAGLMTLYESNYIRLRQLIGRLDALPDRLRSELEGEPPLSLAVVERCRYTTTVQMTYWFATEKGPVSDPDLLVRLYHDAGMAEVRSCHNGRRHRLLRRFSCPRPGEIAQRWAANMMLHKWLEYCLDRHHFDARPGVWRPRQVN